MGHSYSEMHLPTPNETYKDKVEYSRRKFGFSQMECNYQRWFVCQNCSIFTVTPITHIYYCTALSTEAKQDFMDSLEAAKYQIVASLYKQSTDTEKDPWLARLTLLDDCTDAEISAFVFDIAICQLESVKEIAQHHKPVNYGWELERNDKLFVLTTPKEQT